MFFREERKGGCSIHCPAVQLFSLDKPCEVTAPGSCSPVLEGMQGMDTWIPSLIPVLWRVRKCLCASSRGCGGGSFPGIGSTGISPCRQSSVQPFLPRESKLFLGWCCTAPTTSHCLHCRVLLPLIAEQSPSCTWALGTCQDQHVGT